MKLNDKQIQALYRSLYLFILEHGNDQATAFELFNLWSDQNKIYVDDFEWVQIITDWIERQRSEGYEYTQAIAEYCNFTSGRETE